MTEEYQTDVTGAKFDGADLRGVDLSEVRGLTVDQISRAITDETTILPDHLVVAVDSENQN